MKRHVVLIGLPGAGKTTVGQLVAERLQAGFVDVDTVLVRREGRPVTMIFAEKGEGAFRELERKEMESALATSTSTARNGSALTPNRPPNPSALPMGRELSAFR